MTSSRSSRSLRLVAFGLAIAAGVLAFVVSGVVPSGVRGAIGVVGFLALVAGCSSDLRAVNWRTVFWGLGLQVTLALLILRFEIGGRRPIYEFFEALADLVRQFLALTGAGTAIVFGGLADPAVMEQLFPGGFIFAFQGLPVIIFVSAFFTLLYHLGVLQVIVRLMARVMMKVMGTSGAETLAAAANVFMGQTEAPLIVKPYVGRMTQSELLAMMVGGMATIAGSVMAIYIALGADPVAILTTSVMAAPCGLYLAKILLPETAEPETARLAAATRERTHANAVDAVAAGASDGTWLAINVAAMLIAFLAFLALADALLGAAWPGLTLARIFAVVFAPAAVMIGVPMAEVPIVADLLGTKLVANEFVAYLKLTNEYKDLSRESLVLSTYALTGFANLGSIGILIGGIGAMAPARRGDLARLGGKALLGGFMATLINAAIAAMLT
ncbi:MAG TPA: nucleoside transporter C-terminal domain-containing protein [Vicinamibacterales bacterium]|nr:nucleoside transporter C-terminal domain-containing protein [Vicinamibacterales bacterium]